MIHVVKYNSVDPPSCAVIDCAAFENITFLNKYAAHRQMRLVSKGGVGWVFGVAWEGSR